MLAVIAVITVLLLLLVPSISSLKGGADVTSAAYDISGIIGTARSYAIAANTYTWVGFYEENAGTTTPTNKPPAYSGKGSVVIAVIASKDGTKIYNNSANVTATGLATTTFAPVGKLLRIQNLHLTDIGPPAGTTTTNSAASLASRPGTPYTTKVPEGFYPRISSDSSDATSYPFTTGGYTFYKTIQFNPRGEANLNGTDSLALQTEIGLRPTHGTTVNANSSDLVAIQISGTTGNVIIYRQ